MPQKLSALAVGSKVKFGSIYGAPITWIVLEHGHTGYPDGSTTILTEKIIALKCFDAKEPSNSDSNRRSYGNNKWNESNIYQWLNSSGSAGNWYAPQHSADSAPISSNVSCNSYDSESGFLYEFSSNERTAILSTRLNTAGYNESVSSSHNIFLLSSNEVGLESISNNGSAFAYFNSVTRRQSLVTSQAIANSNYSNNPTTTSYWPWWLRTAYTSDSYSVRTVNSNGALNYVNAYYGSSGVRPACNLSSSISVSDTTDSDGCYTLIFNTAPTAPATITVPAEIKATEQFAVTWGASTDTDGNLSGYILERKITTGSTVGSWVQAYKGSARTYNDTLAAGTTKVQYRVKAYDSANANSAYTTSAERTVINNRPPAIAGVDGPLGSFVKTPPAYAYTVTDPDNDEVTVKTYLDGNMQSSGTATLGTETTVTIAPEQWPKILNGEHTFKITATDPDNETATKTVAWSKAVNTAEFVLTTPMEADAKPTTAILNIQGSFPTGSTLSVQICNNGNDAEPAWEDATSAALYGTKHFFTNETKTADEWGVGLKVLLARGSATGDVYVQSIGGNFA